MDAQFAVSDGWRFLVAPRTVRIVGLLVVLLLAQLAFKIGLERGPVSEYYDLPQECYERPWNLLLPVDIGGGQVRWTTTGLVITSWLDRLGSGETSIAILSSLLTAVSFLCSWLAFRSLSFTLTFTICMAFGTQFNYAWVNSSCTLYYLLVAYAEVNLLCAFYLLARPGMCRGAARIGFAVSLLLMALCWETWLDYFVFLSIGSLAGGIYAWQRGRYDLLRALGYMALVNALIAVPYLITRIAFGGTHNQPASECELLLNHAHRTLMIEDFYSNVVTYLYIALTAFLPPWPLSSRAAVMYGADELLRSQSGYHAACAHFVPMHYHYLWHFQAGMAALAFVLLSCRRIVRAANRPSLPRLCAAALCLLVWTGFSTHALIKFRPYLSVPALSYKVTFSVLGVALLLAVAVMSVTTSSRRRLIRVAVPALVWGVVLLGAVTRPHWQGTLLRQVGLIGPPDPLQQLTGTTTRPLP